MKKKQFFAPKAFIFNKISTFAPEFTADLVTLEWDGEGTAGAPYLIHNKEQLDMLATRTNSGSGHAYASTGFSDKYFKLMADIEYNANVEDNFVAIGTKVSSQSDCPFRGHFDGQNHTISRSSAENPLPVRPWRASS